jgi:t-SNARE complex subunit (syntaxin)
MAANDNADTPALSDADVERLAQRVAELLFHKIMRRVAKAAAVTETVVGACVDPDIRQDKKVQPTAAALESVRARRARRGVF